MFSFMWPFPNPGRFNEEAESLQSGQFGYYSSYVRDCNVRLIEQWRERDGMIISTGNKVSIEYTLSLEDKTMVNTNVASQLLTYLHGSHQIVWG